ncbi:MAG: glycine--tRNA ligase subunit beta [Candidatus Omnitrophica bacterium]|nr:glycine--tRNA ligase subunit beta [Candidatus Omnitrophota bacterium]
METRDLILEIGTEEIPSGYFAHILDLLSFKEGSIKEIFEAEHIRIEGAASYSTPRRIILMLKDIPISQDMVIDGPPTRVAYDKAKAPTKALEAFIKKNDASIDDIEVFQDKKEQRVRLTKKGVSNKEALERILPKVIRSLDFPKTMRWNEEDFVFARPLRWILALFGDEILRFSLAGIESSNITYGHRFLGHDKIKVKDADSYFRVLEKNHVMWDNEQRKDKILTFLQKKRWQENMQLLEEVNNLVEYPYFLEGTFKKDYLTLPEEVLLASMSKHQRIFCLKDKQDALTNRFGAVLNGRYRGMRGIRRNYENVLDARLKDAFFFYESDTKKSLADWAEGLGEMVFHKELGTVKEKVERLKEIAAFFLKETGIKGVDKKALSRAISLSKADLLTQMVREFPSLQGVVGGYYALVSGEGNEVATAIGEHYLPRFSGDHLPKTEAAIICSLADKFDNIVCYFKIGKFPKGSWDLYALRRQSIGIISILLNKQIHLSLEKAFDYVCGITPASCDKGKIKVVYLNFFKERFIAFIKEKYDYRYDLLDSVIASGVDDPYDCSLKLGDLDSMIDEPCFEKARCIVERTYNITRSSKLKAEEPKAALFKDAKERSLYGRYKEIRDEFMGLCAGKEYRRATELYGDSLAEEVHSFFADVMVNVSDKDLKKNRTALLSAINRLYRDNIADLSKIVVTRE